MKPPELKAARYNDDGNQRIADAILYELPFMSFLEARDWYAKTLPELERPKSRALLGANDRFFLLASLCHRPDADNEWVYDRCREVEEDPDDHLDLWARYHYKSSIITFAGSIQAMIIDPEITIAIFGNTLDISQPFLDQIKLELESNQDLKHFYPDVFWQDPQKEAPVWSSKEGLIVRRRGNPKEPTISAHGLLNAMPTGGHFALRIYNDVVTEKSVSQTNTDQISKTTVRWELSQNLGTANGGRMWHEGTRYHFADTYGVLIDRGSLKPRVYPATHDATLNGTPVFLSDAAWAKIKLNQRDTIAAQMLLNPTAGSESTFLMDWLRPFEIRPNIINIYILCDPSMGTHATSDRTAMPVIAEDTLSNFYLVDGYRHRMTLSQRTDALFELFRKWKNAPNVQQVRVGYERYGMQADMEHIEIERRRRKIEGLNVEEVSWVKQGQQSKTARIGRLEPMFRNSSFWMPPKVWHPDHGGVCTWRVNAEKGEILYSPYKGASKAERTAVTRGERYRLMDPIRRVDEDGNIYDLARVFFEEFKLMPFAPHDDLLDAVSRVVDLEPLPPQVFERAAKEEEVDDA